MVPRAQANAQVLRRRKRYFTHRISTSHWPLIEGSTDSDEEALFDYYRIQINSNSSNNHKGNTKGAEPQPWTTRNDILQLVGYSEAEITSIQQGTYSPDTTIDSKNINCVIS
mmetsp:Transcript_27693/g.46511  ORF Transcript_27693/g.46511 Transcript_27693/m.46511 type:complete len:112 (-) Transcript_27693:95-430(-)